MRNSCTKYFKFKMLLEFSTPLVLSYAKSGRPSGLVAPALAILDMEELIHRYARKI